MSHLVIVSLILTIVATNYSPQKLYDKKIIKTNLQNAPTDIQWGTGYNSLTLSRTYNSPTVPSEIRRRETPGLQMSMKVCKSGGEVLDYLAGDKLNVKPFLVIGERSGPMAQYFQISKIDDTTSVLVGKLEVTAATWEMTGIPSLKPGTRDLLQAGHYKSFVQAYGTHFLHKVVFGGHLYIVLKVGCNSRLEKERVDVKLARYSGSFSSVDQWIGALRGVEKTVAIAIEINMFSVGARETPPVTNIRGVIQFTTHFIQQVTAKPKIEEIEYISVFHLQENTFGLRDFSLLIQDRTDKIAQISASFLDANRRINNILCRISAHDITYFSATGVEKLQVWNSESARDQSELQTLFQVADMESGALDHIINKYRDTPRSMDKKVTDLLLAEKRFDSSHSFYLKSKGALKYVSMDAAGYPKLTKTSPIKLKFITNSEYGEVAYDRQDVLITSETKRSNEYLCMGANNWYVFWLSKHQLIFPSVRAMCSWRLHSTRGSAHKHVEFSDDLIVINVYWPGYAIGVTEDGRWLLDAEKVNAVADARHQWIIEKTPWE